jgi:hypothetical protein
VSINVPSTTGGYIVIPRSILLQFPSIKNIFLTQIDFKNSEYVCLYTSGRNFNFSDSKSQQLVTSPEASVLAYKNEESILFDPGFLGLGPMYYVKKEGIILGVSSEPSLLAALYCCPLNKQAIYQDITIGFRIAENSIFEDVSKILPGMGMVVQDGCISLKQFHFESPTYVLAEEQLLDELPAYVAQSFSEGYISELTGGIDSRLLIALGLSGGGKPNMAFTIGDANSADVLAAKNICHELGVAHKLLGQGFDEVELFNDTIDFLTRSGFTSNAASYGWLPTVYRSLAPFREGQISGAGGECAGDFYFTPLDSIVKTNKVRDLWINYRLLRSGNKFLSLMAENQRNDLLSSVKVSVNNHLDSSTYENWCEGLNKLYTHHRVRNWVGPVLNASSHWYDVKAPLLSSLYINWANKVPNKQRKGRASQLALISKLSPSLAGMPYEKDLNSHPIFGNSRFAEISIKVSKRLMQKKTKEDLGTVSVVDELFRLEYYQSKAALLIRDFFGISEEGVSKIFSSPIVFSNELGYIFTALQADLSKEKYVSFLRK